MLDVRPSEPKDVDQTNAFCHAEVRKWARADHGQIDPLEYSTVQCKREIKLRGTSYESLPRTLLAQARRDQPGACGGGPNAQRTPRRLVSDGSRIITQPKPQSRPFRTIKNSSSRAASRRFAWARRATIRLRDVGRRKSRDGGHDGRLQAIETTLCLYDIRKELATRISRDRSKYLIGKERMFSESILARLPHWFFALPSLVAPRTSDVSRMP